MDNTNEKQKVDVLNNIKEMKRIMDINIPVLRKIFLPRNMSLLFLIWGCYVLFFSLAYHVLLVLFDKYELIPVTIKYIYIILLIISSVIMVFMRITVTFQAGLSAENNYNPWKLVKQVWSSRIWITIFPVIVILCLIPIKAFPYWPENYYVPYISIVVGIFSNMIGSGSHVFEYYLTGYWLIITGLISIFFISMPFQIALAVNIAPGFILFSIVAYIRDKNNNE